MVSRASPGRTRRGDQRGQQRQEEGAAQDAPDDERCPQSGGARDESAALQGEISRFFERTQKTNYGAVSKEMKDSRATDELERLGGMIGAA